MEQETQKNEQTNRVEKIGNRMIAALAPGKKPFHVRDSELTGFMVRQQPSGAASYIFEYRTPDGRRPRITIAKVGVITPTQARDRARELAADVVKGSFPHTAKKTEQVPTMEQFLVERYEPWISSSKKTGAQTIARLRATFPFLLQRQLSAITPWDIEKWRSERVKAGINKATTNRGFVSIKAMLNKATEWDVITENPLRKLKTYRVDSNPRTRYLSTKEESRLRQVLIDREAEIRAGRERGNCWRTLRQYDLYPSLEGKTFAGPLRPLVLVALNTGLRRGSLANLRKEDVDLVGKKLTVPAAYAKGGKTYHVPLNSEAYEVLSRWIQENSDNPSPLVFPSRTGKPIRELKTAWNKVLEKADVRQFRFHDTRHSFASKLVIAGVPLNTVRVLLDHSTPNQTTRYAHLNEETTAAAVAKLCEPKQETQAKDTEGPQLALL